MKLNGSLFYDEIREKSANIIIKMIIRFLKNFPKYKLEKQKIFSRFYKYENKTRRSKVKSK